MTPKRVSARVVKAVRVEVVEEDDDDDDDDDDDEAEFASEANSDPSPPTRPKTMSHPSLLPIQGRCMACWGVGGGFYS